MPLSLPTWATKAMAAAVAGAVAVGLYVGTRALREDSTNTHAVVDWVGTPPADARCLYLTGLINNTVANTFHLTPTADGGTQYVYDKICGSPIDGGTSANIPPGMLALSDSEGEEAYDGGPQLEVWTTGDANAPWPCACSTGSNCSVQQFAFNPETGMFALDGQGNPVLETVAAPLGQTLQPGWSGAGCKRMTCLLIGGQHYWPAECPLQ